MAMQAPEDYLALVDDVTEVSELDDRNPLDGWRPTPPALRLMSDPSKKKGFRGPNQLSKTETGAVELLHRMRGTHPYLKTHAPPIECWVVCSSWKQSLVIQRKIWALIPKDELDESVTFSRKNGFAGQWFGLKNGSMCTIVTANQETVDLASATLHFIWCDEPPTEAIWSELVARLTQNRGTLLLTYTPIGRPVGWLREKCEAGEISDHHFVLSTENATPLGSVIPFRSQQAIDEFKKDCLPTERAQRCDAAWEGVAEGRIIEAFHDGLVTAKLPTVECEFSIGIDHGAKAGRQCAVLTAVAMVNGKPMAWVLDEARSDGRTATEEDAQSILQMLSRHGLTVRNVDYWRGDRAHSGDWRGNQKSNRDLKRAIATILGVPVHRLPEPLQRISVPKKWQGSVSYGARMVNKLCASDRLFFNPNAKTLIEGVKQWEGALQDPHKDPVDALRYSLEPLIDARVLWGAGHTFAHAA